MIIMAFKATKKARFKKMHASSSAGSKKVQAREVMEKKQQQMRSPSRKEKKKTEVMNPSKRTVSTQLQKDLPLISKISTT